MFHWIEEHPYLTGSLVLGIIVIYFVMSGSGGSSAPVVQAAAGGGASAGGVNPNTALQTSAALQANANAATVHNNDTSAALAAKTLEVQAMTVQSGYDRDARLQEILTSGQVQNHAADAALAAVYAQTGGQVQIATIGAARDESIAGINAGVSYSQIAANLEAQRAISDASTQQNAADNASKTQIADYMRQISLAGIDSENYKTTVGGQVSLAGIDANKTVSLAGIGANKDVLMHHDDVTLDAYKDYNKSQTDQTALALSFKDDIYTKGLGVVSSGVLNKGGDGGANQVSFLSTLFGGGGYAPTPAASGFGFSIPGVASVSVKN